MALKDYLWQTATIKSVTYNDSNDPVYATLYTNIPTRRESTQRLIVDKNGRDILANFLFFFDYANVTDLKPDYQIVFGGVNYTVVRADLLPAKDSNHHWETLCR